MKYNIITFSAISQIMFKKREKIYLIMIKLLRKVYEIKNQVFQSGLLAFIAYFDKFSYRAILETFFKNL